MRVCIVGQGPTAEGKGQEIDACDFVVRLRGFWQCAAQDAGQKVNAHAYFGWPYNNGGTPRLLCEHWFTHCPEQVNEAGEAGMERLRYFVEMAGMSAVRILSNSLWHKLWAYIGSHPSTGFVAVAMAMERFRGCELVLYGFDSTLPSEDNYWDARQNPDHATLAHDMLAEKKAIAEIKQGKWLGEETHVTLTWPDMPNLDVKPPPEKK